MTIASRLQMCQAGSPSPIGNKMGLADEALSSPWPAARGWSVELSRLSPVINKRLRSSLTGARPRRCLGLRWRWEYGDANFLRDNRRIKQPMLSIAEHKLKRVLAGW